MTELKAYVLRYWETEFSQLKPTKNRAGNRTYRQKDIETILNIKDLLYKKKFTINGARGVLQGRDKFVGEAKDPNSISKNQKVVLSKIKKSLEEILNIINDLKNRSVAQPGSAPQWGCGGRKFKSCRSDFY